MVGFVIKLVIGIDLLRHDSGRILSARATR